MTATKEEARVAVLGTRLHALREAHKKVRACKQELDRIAAKQAHQEYIDKVLKVSADYLGTDDPGMGFKKDTHMDKLMDRLLDPDDEQNGYLYKDILRRMVPGALSPDSKVLVRALGRLQGADGALVRMFVLELLAERVTLRASLLPFANLGYEVAKLNATSKKSAHIYQPHTVMCKRGTVTVCMKHVVIAKAVHSLTATVGDLKNN